MKMNREQLKGLIKECIVEVFNEGLGGALKAPTSRAMGVAEARIRSPQRSSSTFDPALDTPIRGGRVPQAALKSAIREVAGGNDVMASIFEDTAKTSLPSMLSGEGEGGSSRLSLAEHINGTPEEIFGEDTASKWAALAFNEVPTSKKTA